MKEKKRILLINNSYPTRKHPNAGTFIVSIEEALKKSGYEVEKLVIFRLSNSPFIKLFQHISMFFKVLFLYINRYDFVYINHYTFLFFPLVVKLRFFKGVPVFHWHGSDVVSNSFKDKIIKFFIRKLDRTIENGIHIVPSHFFSQILRHQFHSLKKNIFISPSGGVDSSLFKVKESKKENKVRIGFCSALTENKGVDLLYSFSKAIEKVEKKISCEIELHYIKYGIGYQKWDERLKSVIGGKIVTYDPMPKEKMPAFYQNIDILFMLSKQESLGLVTLEAMSCNIPVITRDICAMPEFILSGESGELIPEDATERDLITAFLNIFSNLKQYNPRRIIEKKYSFEAVVRQYIGILRLSSNKAEERKSGIEILD